MESEYVEVEEEEYEAAKRYFDERATRIQKVWRGWKARREIRRRAHK